MRLLIGSLLILLFITNPAFGQLTEIKLDNSSMPGTDIAEVSINQAGELVITSRNGVEYEIVEKNVIPGDAAINSFTLNNEVSVNLSVGATATLRWSTSNVTACSASSTPVDALAGWNTTTVIGVSGPLTVAFPVAGIYNLHLECTGDNDSVDSKVVTAQVGAASITTFTVSPNTAEKGTDVSLTLSWTSANTSVGCAGSSNWPNSSSLPSSGTRNISVLDIQADTVYTLTCFGTFDEDSATALVTVTEPLATCDVTLSSRTIRNWEDVFRTAWPGPAQTQIRVSVPDRGYYSVKFSTGNVVDAGLLSNIEASGTSGARLGALSEIPGCFDVAEECKYSWGRSGGIVWDTTGTQGRCQLKPNTDYYWNMTFTNGASSSTSTCIGTYCETYLMVVNPN